MMRFFWMTFLPLSAAGGAAALLLWLARPDQTSMRAMQFGQREIDREALVSILEEAICYAINFDLLLPPYEGPPAGENRERKR